MNTKKQEPYSKIPNRIIDTLPDQELKIYCVLIRFYSMKKGAFPGIETIAKCAQKKTRATQNILLSLERKGYIRREYRPGKTTIIHINHYAEDDVYSKTKADPSEMFVCIS